MADLGDGDMCDKDIRAILESFLENDFENEKEGVICDQYLEEILDNLPLNLRRVYEKINLERYVDGSTCYSIY